jgi:2-dehydropantoate 2-reductase
VGASGGHFAVRLSKAGHDVSVVARGENLTAIQLGGLRLAVGEHELKIHPRVAHDPGELGAQDLVIVSVKATALAAVSDGLAPLVGPRTLVLFTQNGMPWWYPLGLPADAPKPPPLQLFALGERFLKTVPTERILGGLVYSANEAREPGFVVNKSPGDNRLEIASISKESAVDVEAIRTALIEAHIGSPGVPDMRRAIWKKLLYNLSGSVIALATGNKSSVSREDEALGAIYRRVVLEGLAIAAAHGYPLDDELVPEAMRQKTLDHKPSLLQDYERRRPMEIAEIVLAPLEFARAANVPIPALETLGAVVARLARDRGLLA